MGIVYKGAGESRARREDETGSSGVFRRRKQRRPQPRHGARLEASNVLGILGQGASRKTSWYGPGWKLELGDWSTGEHVHKSFESQAFLHTVSDLKKARDCQLLVLSGSRSVARLTVQWKGLYPAV